jgi:hypothetical protein
LTNDRELLECPRCGLPEDVTSTGLLITCCGATFGEDTGMRFVQLTMSSGGMSSQHFLIWNIFL